MSKYNHMYVIAFTVENASPHGEKTTPQELRHGLLDRLAGITDVELLEAVGGPEDTYCLDDFEPAEQEAQS